mgnify:CR=1 FL=1
MTAPNDPPTLGGVPFPPCVEVATDRRTAPIIGIPFDLKPCPIEELSPEMIEAAKAAEREAHPLQVLLVPPPSPEQETLLAPVRAALREFEAQGVTVCLPPGAEFEFIYHDEGPSPSLPFGSRSELRYEVSLDTGRFVSAVRKAAATFARMVRDGGKRPGQWGWRARAKRHARRLAADDRKVAEWQRRQGYNRPLNRRQLRALGIYEPMPRGR